MTGEQQRVNIPTPGMTRVKHSCVNVASDDMPPQRHVSRMRHWSPFLQVVHIVHNGEDSHGPERNEQQEAHLEACSADRRMNIIAALITAEGISRVLDFVGERVAD